MKLNKLDRTSPTFTLSPAPSADLDSAGRLIVLCPASETEPPKPSNQIWEIARSLGLNVLLVSLSHDHGEDAQLRRKLIIMSAIIKDANIPTEILIERGSDWVKQVGKILRAGDVVACYASQRTGFLRKPLGQTLKSGLNVPVYILHNEK